VRDTNQLVGRAARTGGMDAQMGGERLVGVVQTSRNPSLGSRSSPSTLP
jgi:hypothetical protein